MQGELFEGSKAPLKELSSRNTNDGLKVEKGLAGLVVGHGWSVQRQVCGGRREDGTGIRLDLVITRCDQKQIVVSSKSQNSGGTGEDKMPHEVMTLASVLEKHPQYQEAVIVLLGKKFTAKKVAWWKSGGLSRKLATSCPSADRVRFMTYGDFCEAVATGTL